VSIPIPIRISVVIPIYNRQDLLSRAIDSVLQQTRPADEIIVVNDGSTDGTSKALRQYGNQIKILNQTNQGVSAARNAGIRNAIGNWIALLDSDDAWLPEKLQQAENFIHKNPETQIFQSEELWVRNGRRVNPKNKHKKIGGDIFSASLPLCIVSPSAVLIHKPLLDEMGLFDESFPVCEDYDLWLRISQRFPFGLDPFPGIIKYGGHADQLSTKYWGMDRFRIRALEKLLDNNHLTESQRNQVLNELLKKLEILISGYEKHHRDTHHYRQQLSHYKNLLSAIHSQVI